MGNAIEIVAMQPDLWVMAHGERFCDESLAFNDTHSGNVNLRFADDGYTSSACSTTPSSTVYWRWSRPHPHHQQRSRLQAPHRTPGTGGSPRGRHHRDLFGRLGRGVGPLGRHGPQAILQATVDEYNRFCAGRHVTTGSG